MVKRCKWGDKVKPGLLNADRKLETKELMTCSKQDSTSNRSLQWYRWTLAITQPIEYIFFPFLVCNFVWELIQQLKLVEFCRLNLVRFETVFSTSGELHVAAQWNYLPGDFTEPVLGANNLLNPVSSGFIFLIIICYIVCGVHTKQVLKKQLWHS